MTFVSFLTIMFRQTVGLFSSPPLKRATTHRKAQKSKSFFIIATSLEVKNLGKVRNKFKAKVCSFIEKLTTRISCTLVYSYCYKRIVATILAIALIAIFKIEGSWYDGPNT